MSRVPGCVYSTRGECKTLHTIEEIEAHMENGWADKPFPAEANSGSGSTEAPPCANCEQLRAERDDLRSRLSALIAQQHKLPADAAAGEKQPEGPIPGVDDGEPKGDVEPEPEKVVKPKKK